MAFLDELRNHLHSRNAPTSTFQPNTAALRKHVVERLGELEASGAPEDELRKQLDRWSRDLIAPFARSVGRALLNDFAHGCSTDELEQWIKLALDRGIERIFRFLQDISSIADLASTPSDLFEIRGPVNEAIAAVTSDLGLSIPFDSPPALPAVRGHRDRFSLALVNVLRNAAQSRPREGLVIRVSAGTRNGAEVYVAVEDNGPGVPAEHRATIFEPGFSLRPQGSGQGLALVREVIESEMAGQVVCEQSDLGGARIVLRLPVGSKRKL